MITVVAGVVYREGKIMVYQRPEGKDLAGKWEFPGGKLEEGESPEEALVRELKEELDIEARPGRVLDVLRKGSAGKDILLMFYACSAKGEPAPQEKGTVRFIAPEETALLDFAPMDRLFLERGGLARLTDEAGALAEA